MKLTDEQLRRLIVSDPDDAGARAELRKRIRTQAVRALPSPEGTCAAGRRVRLDDKSVYSSGYFYHIDSIGNTCDHYPVEWDKPTGKRARLLALIEELKD